MFQPILLPFFLTIVLMAALVAAATFCAPRLKMRREAAFNLATLLALVAFIPACAGIGFAVDKFRFGTFAYAKFEDVNDYRVEQFLPPAARDITVHKYASGFVAKYRIAEPELRAFLDELWAKHGDQSDLKRSDFATDSTLDEQLHAVHFGREHGRPFVPGMKHHQSPVAPTGAGCTLWYSAAEGIAYSRATYW